MSYLTRGIVVFALFIAAVMVLGSLGATVDMVCFWMMIAIMIAMLFVGVIR